MLDVDDMYVEAAQLRAHVRLADRMYGATQDVHVLFNDDVLLNDVLFMHGFIIHIFTILAVVVFVFVFVFVVVVVVGIVPIGHVL